MLSLAFFMFFFLAFTVDDKGKTCKDVTEKGKSFSSQRYNVANRFTFRELCVATQNFKDSNLIGEGGFGCVYKGRLESGKVSFCSCFLQIINLSLGL